MKNPWPWLVLVVVAVAAGLWWFQLRAVDTRPLPQVQPTLDAERPTQPVREVAPTATATPG